MYFLFYFLSFTFAHIAPFAASCKLCIIHFPFCSCGIRYYRFLSTRPVFGWIYTPIIGRLRSWPEPEMSSFHYTIHAGVGEWRDWINTELNKRVLETSAWSIRYEAGAMEEVNAGVRSMLFPTVPKIYVMITGSDYD